MSLLVWVQRGDYKACVRALENGEDPNIVNYTGQSPIHIAVDNNNKECLKLLLDHGANPNIVSQHLFGWGRGPLHTAVSCNRFELVKMLLSVPITNPNIEDIYGFTPLHFASYYGHDALISILLSHGALIDYKSLHGDTPLHCACLNSQMTTVKLLLDSGCDIYITNNEGKRAHDLSENEDIKVFIKTYDFPIVKSALDD